jgi:hypothetical protein
MIAHVEKIDGLGTTGSFADKCQFATIGQRVDRSGFSGIGTAGKCHLGTLIRGHIGDLMYGIAEFKLREQGH